jgi:hypothetical protein
VARNTVAHLRRREEHCPRSHCGPAGDTWPETGGSFELSDGGVVVGATIGTIVRFERAASLEITRATLSFTTKTEAEPKELSTIGRGAPRGPAEFATVALTARP